MGRLLLKFDDAVLREVSLGSRAVTIGRAPDNDIPIDNLAVSNYHARIYTEAGRLVIEDLNSLNGTFVNDQPARFGVDARVVVGDGQIIDWDIVIGRAADGHGPAAERDFPEHRVIELEQQPTHVIDLLPKTLRQMDLRPSGAAAPADPRSQAAGEALRR